jgi:hypothetical protein
MTPPHLLMRRRLISSRGTSGRSIPQLASDCCRLHTQGPGANGVSINPGQFSWLDRERERIRPKNWAHYRWLVGPAQKSTGRDRLDRLTARVEGNAEGDGVALPRGNECRSDLSNI